MPLKCTDKHTNVEFLCILTHVTHMQTCTWCPELKLLIVANNFFCPKNFGWLWVYWVDYLSNLYLNQTTARCGQLPFMGGKHKLYPIKPFVLYNFSLYLSIYLFYIFVRRYMCIYYNVLHKYSRLHACISAWVYGVCVEIPLFHYTICLWFNCRLHINDAQLTPVLLLHFYSTDILGWYS